MIFLPPGVLQQQIPSGPVTLVSDTFTDSDSTALTSHTPDTDSVGSGWTVYSNTWIISTNRAAPTLGGAAVAGIETNEADATIETTVHLGSSLSGGVVARLSDVDNLWLGWGADGKLYEKNAGSFTERADCGAPSAEPNTMSLVCSGASITFNADTSLTANYASATFNQTETIHGMRSFSATFHHDDFSVVG